MREEAVDALRLGLELLEHVRELEDLLQARPVEQHPVVRVEECDPAAASSSSRAAMRLRVDAELPLAALDDRGLARLADGVPPAVALFRDAGCLERPLCAAAASPLLRRTRAGLSGRRARRGPIACAAPPGRRSRPDPVACRKSSMVGTWFEPVHPSGARLTCAVSGMSAASSGPSAFSRARTSLRKREFASSH